MVIAYKIILAVIPISEACAILLALIIAHTYDFQSNIEIRTDCLEAWIQRFSDRENISYVSSYNKIFNVVKLLSLVLL